MLSHQKNKSISEINEFISMYNCVCGALIIYIKAILFFFWQQLQQNLLKVKANLITQNQEYKKIIMHLI